MESCIFCKIIKRQIPSSKVYEDKQVYAFLDIAPVNKGHTLVIPKEHYEDLDSTPEATAQAMVTTVKKLAPIIVASTNAQGYNLHMSNKKAAGQEVFHAHMHIIPRIEGDNKFRWVGKSCTQEEMQQVQSAILKKL